MDDLIYRQAAIDVLHGYFDGMLETDTWSPCDVYGLIEILPSADAVEVVRCEDCKYYHPTYCEIWSRFGTMQTREKGYCYMGERKDG